MSNNTKKITRGFTPTDYSELSPTLIPGDIVMFEHPLRYEEVRSFILNYNSDIDTEPSQPSHPLYTDYGANCFMVLAKID